MANPLFREVRVYINKVQSKALLSLTEKKYEYEGFTLSGQQRKRDLNKKKQKLFLYLFTLNEPFVPLYLSLVGTQQFWSRASKREFEMPTRKPEWRLASKIHLHKHTHSPRGIIEA